MTTVRTIADLLQVFRDGQAADTIPPEDFRDLIVSLYPTTGNFQDLPQSQSGLTSGRLWLNGDVLSISGGSAPSQPLASYLAAATGRLSAIARQRMAASGRLSGSAGLSATANIPSVFFDGFDALSLYDQFGSVPGTWYPSAYFPPQNQGEAVNNTWMLNPFNPATPISGAYSVSGGQLRLLMQDTPPALLSAVGNEPYVGQRLVAPGVATFGKFEVRLSVPALNGTECSVFLISNSGGANPVTTEIDLIEIVTSSSWSPRTQWSTSVKPPGYPPGVGNLAEFFSFNPGAPVIDVTQMNVYAVDVRPTYVATSVNGTEVMRLTPPPSEFGHAPWDIYIYQGGVPDWAGPLDATPNYQPYLIDYVRVTA